MVTRYDQRLGADQPTGDIDPTKSMDGTRTLTSKERDLRDNFKKTRQCKKDIHHIPKQSCLPKAYDLVNTINTNAFTTETTRRLSRSNSFCDDIALPTDASMGQFYSPLTPTFHRAPHDVENATKQRDHCARRPTNVSSSRPMNEWADRTPPIGRLLSCVAGTTTSDILLSGSTRRGY